MVGLKLVTLLQAEASLLLLLLPFLSCNNTFNHLLLLWAIDEDLPMRFSSDPLVTLVTLVLTLKWKESGPRRWSRAVWSVAGAGPRAGRTPPSRLPCLQVAGCSLQLPPSLPPGFLEHLPCPGLGMAFHR